MPIFKNGEPYKVPETQIEFIKEKFQRNGAPNVSIGIPKELITKNSKGKPQAPKIYFPLTAQANMLKFTCKGKITLDSLSGKREDTISTISYFESTKPHPQIKGEVILMPKTYDLDTPSKPIVAFSDPLNQKWELLWFLYFYSPFCKNGLSFDPKKASYFEIIDIQGEAEQEFERNKQEMAVKELLYGKDSIKRETLVNIAAAMDIKNVQDASVEVITKRIWDRMNEKDPRTGKLTKPANSAMNLFLKLASETTYREKRTLLFECMNMNVIGEHKGAWYYMDEEGKPSSEIVTITNKDNKMGDLYKYLESTNGWESFNKVAQPVLDIVMSREEAAK